MAELAGWRGRERDPPDGWISSASSSDSDSEFVSARLVAVLLAAAGAGVGRGGGGACMVAIVDRAMLAFRRWSAGSAVKPEDVVDGSLHERSCRCWAV